jgi:serine protease Do
MERFRNPGEPAPEEDIEFREPRERRENSAGSGFLITADGYLMTNNHVIEGADRLIVTLQDGTQYDGEVIGTDPGIDFALMKIDTRGRELPYLALGNSDALRVGEWVLAIGNPLEFSHSVTAGVVSAKDRTVPLRGTDIAVALFIQTDAAINLGNSGGPLVNARGEVVGINTAINRERLAEGIGFALPIAAAIRSKEQILETGEVRRGILGVTMNQNSVDADAMAYYGLPDRNGVIVSEVTENGPAARAGIRPEDIIRKVDGAVVRGNTDMIAKIAAHKPGDEVRLEVIRDGETLIVEAELAERGLRNGRIEMITDETAEPEAEPEPVPATGLGLTVETYTVEALSGVLPHEMPRGNLEPDLEGALVSYVELSSVAHDKGLAPGLVITEFGTTPIRDADDWRGAMREVRAGEIVKLVVRSPFRNAVPRFVYLTVPDEP